MKANRMGGKVSEGDTVLVIIIILLLSHYSTIS